MPVSKPYTPVAFLGQLAGGQTCIGTDRDGEAWIKILLSRADAARVMERMDELSEAFYVTFVPEREVHGTRGRRKSPGKSDAT
jgi:hypothetical protein